MVKRSHIPNVFADNRIGVAMLAMLLALASVTGVMAQALGPAGPSPASGDASVIAQGVYDVTDSDYVWQVSTYTAEVGSEPLAVVAPTFVIARATPLLVTDVTSGIRQRVANGEALFLSPGQSVRLETFGPPDDFIFVELTPDNAASSGADPLVGQVFQPLAGSRDIDLVRDVVNAGEASELPGGAGRTLVFGLAGQITAVGEDGAEMPILAGDIVEFAGPVTFTGVTDGSEYVAAYIGAVIGFGDEAAATPPSDGEVAPAASPASTGIPTEAPTEVPTVAPTLAPTNVPTVAPTDVPTVAPTDVPTEVPTDVPTEAPTVVSTDIPTEQPTEIPTVAPTDVPTLAPTEAPTEIPTIAATEVPTQAPTEAPTQAPTVVPTEVSTIAATVAPTETPTSAPTVAPTIVATVAPAAPASPVPAETDVTIEGAPFPLEIIDNDPGTDEDDDGLTDVQEEFYGTNPANADTDGDGIVDGPELVDYGLNPNIADMDDDGINDSNELFIYQTDPVNLDSDGDILYDGGELVYNADPLDPDSDGDGLTDGEEVYFAETDPANADTDDDGINDFDEVVNGTDPLVANDSSQAPDPVRRGDSDRDGLTNAQEGRYGTDPQIGDSDGDRVNDSNEIAAGTNPLDITSWPR